MRIGVEHGTESAEFFRGLRAAGDDKSTRVLIDFRECTDISVDACLMLHGEIYRLRAKKGAEMVRSVLPAQASARRRLKVTGLMRAVNGDPRQLEGVSYDPHGSNVVVIETGIALDGGESLGLAKSFAQGLNLNEVDYKPIHSALNDALENISEHAYEGAAQSEERRWWACSIGFPDDPQSFLLAYDLGVTIPATVPRTARKVGERAMESLKRLLKRDDPEGADQTELLRAAFDPAVTRRESGKGGRGLPSMRQLAEQHGGSLTVWSGRAAAWTDDKLLNVKEIAGGVDGTLVLWCVGEKAEAET